MLVLIIYNIDKGLKVSLILIILVIDSVSHVVHASIDVTLELSQPVVINLDRSSLRCSLHNLHWPNWRSVWSNLNLWHMLWLLDFNFRYRGSLDLDFGHRRVSDLNLWNWWGRLLNPNGLRLLGLCVDDLGCWRRNVLDYWRGRLRNSDRLWRLVRWRLPDYNRGLRNLIF